ncbi:hypothetical protein RHS04_05878 [Rhizoctonia solani]|uniref:Uncharacterized protein n=1 Tax=Rhizoctonia solani TaxID=456999 RepID=A0A8H7H7Y3_9AGAM|nr:hypothetical protein RHS04_05878 [Rhizoctonia solani]
MSLFRSPSFRLKKREKAQRPPPLQEMPENKEQEASGATDNGPGSSFLIVPDTARSTFFALPSGMSSRSSLFGRNSTSSQDEKKGPSFFKFSNLSRGSFVLRREREERKWARSDELTRTSGSSDGSHAYVPKSKRSESASNLLELVKNDTSAPPSNSNVRQRSRTLSTKSLPDTPDHQRRVFTELPPLAIPPPSTTRVSLETPAKPKAVTVPPRLSLDTPIHRVSPIRLPSFSTLPTTLEPVSPSVFSDPASPTSPGLDESTVTLNMGLHSPSPTIISATTMSTIQESLLGDYGVSTSSCESDHDQTFASGEDEYGHKPNSVEPTDSKKQLDGSGRVPPKLTVTSSGQTSPLEPPGRDEPVDLLFAGPPELPDVIPSPFKDPLESYFADIPSRSSSRSSLRSSEASTSRLSVPTTPVHKLAANPVQEMSPTSPVSSLSPSPSPRKPRPRKVPPALTSQHRSSPSRSNTLTVPIDEPPPTPSSPSFLLGLSWPRPPLRQIYIDSGKPNASWHAVSRTIDEQLIDGTGMVNTDPCHVIIIANAGAGSGIAGKFIHSGMSGGRRRSGTVMRDQQPLTPTAVSALTSFAVQTAPLVST